MQAGWADVGVTNSMAQNECYFDILIILILLKKKTLVQMFCVRLKIYTVFSIQSFTYF